MQLVWVLQKTTIATQVVITRDPGRCFFYESYKLKLQVACCFSVEWIPQSEMWLSQPLPFPPLPPLTRSGLAVDLDVGYSGNKCKLKIQAQNTECLRKKCVLEILSGVLLKQRWFFQTNTIWKVPNVLPFIGKIYIAVHLKQLTV